MTFSDFLVNQPRDSGGVGWAELATEAQSSPGKTEGYV